MTTNYHLKRQEERSRYRYQRSQMESGEDWVKIKKTVPLSDDWSFSIKNCKKAVTSARGTQQLTHQESRELGGGTKILHKALN